MQEVSINILQIENRGDVGMVFGIEKGKALVLYRVMLIFHQDCLGVQKLDIMVAFIEFFSIGRIHRSMNSTFISLLNLKKDTMSLLNSDHQSTSWGVLVNLFGEGCEVNTHSYMHRS